MEPIAPHTTAREVREAAPHYMKIFPEDGDSFLDVVLHVPDDTTECPISLEPIATAEVDLFVGLLLEPSLPHHRAITLPCKHCFAAAPLAIYWLNDAMRCPLCRAGIDGLLAVHNFPLDWRQRVACHKRRRKMIDTAEATIDNHEGNLFSRRAMLCFMVVTVLLPGGNSTVVPVTFHAHPSYGDERLRLVVSRAHLRQLSSIITRGHAYAVNLSICVENLVGDERQECVCVAESGIILLPTCDNMMSSTAAEVHIVQRARRSVESSMFERASAPLSPRAGEGQRSSSQPPPTRVASSHMDTSTLPPTAHFGNEDNLSAYETAHRPPRHMHQDSPAPPAAPPAAPPPAPPAAPPPAPPAAPPPAPLRASARASARASTRALARAVDPSSAPPSPTRRSYVDAQDRPSSTRSASWQWQRSAGDEMDGVFHVSTMFHGSSQCLTTITALDFSLPYSEFLSLIEQAAGFRTA
jgi:hypothetical protein